MSKFIINATPDNPAHCDNCETEVTAGRFDMRWSSVLCQRCATISNYVDKLWDDSIPISWEDAEYVLLERGVIEKIEVIHACNQ